MGIGLKARIGAGFRACQDVHQAGSFFVMRAKFKRLVSRPVERSTGLIRDQVVELTVFYSHQGYPDRLRRIRFKDPETAKTLVFLTNHFALPAFTIGALYKSRWQVELFFRWIKQHLCIKRFFGTSENAVKTQVWIAVAVYVLAAIIRGTDASGEVPETFPSGV